MGGMGKMGKIRVTPEPLGLRTRNQLGEWAARIAIGTAGLTGASIVPASADAQAPTTSIVDPSMSASPLQIFTDPNVVPVDIVEQAMKRGVNRGTHVFRTKGISEDHSFFSPIQHPGRIMDRVVEGLNAAGIEVDRVTGTAYDWFKPLTALLLLSGISMVIMQDYRKRPIVGGVTTLAESVGLTGAAGTLLMVGWIYTAPYTISALLRDGFVLSSFRSNYGASTANFLVMGMWAFLGAWSLVSRLTFRLPGLVFQHVFMRDRTRHEPTILSGDRLFEATVENVRELFRTGRGRFKFSIEAAHLQDANVAAATQQLANTPVTATISGIPYTEFLTLRGVVRDQGGVVTVTTIQNIRNRNVTDAHFTQVNRATVLIAGSRLADNDATRAWADGVAIRDRVYWQRKAKGTGRVLILKQDINLNELPQNGLMVTSGVLKHHKSHQGLPSRREMPGSGTYTVQFQGPAATLMPQLARAISRRPFVSGVRPRAIFFSPLHLTPAPVRSALHSALWPTNLTIELTDPNTPDDAVYGAIATIAGQQRYVVQPKSPLVPVSRAVIESMNMGVVTLAMERREWERGANSLGSLVDPDSVETSTDYPSMVNFPVNSVGLVMSLNGRSTLSRLIREGKIKLVVPAPRCAPQNVVRNLPEEAIAIQVPPGDMTALDDLRFPKVEGSPVPWWQFLGRSVRQGVRYGRLPAISATTLVSGPLSAPITISTKALTGYTDPSTWLVSGGRVFVSGFVNLLFTPGVRGMVRPERFNNYLAFLPGLLILAGLFEPINDVAHGEPPRMWVRSLEEDLSYENRPIERAQALANLHREEASITDTEGREFVLSLRLGNLLPTGYYTAKDLGLVTKMYIKQLSQDPQAARRLLAGIISDPGFVYLVQRDPVARDFFMEEIQRQRSEIQAVLHTERPNLDSEQLFSAFGLSVPSGSTTSPQNVGKAGD
ncbi:MAG: hypothetical protein COV45_03255 [Deltaproteobacteria bacterium CG11_big_fil_rev_8_21_14_0_20_47_16]|nr:MAG: hypothetical protein COV45_03255 [Deltaproteobacteria bacterium CG11_big_fil_rev_8_21_14_0_20_47_16]